jgi:hypothetical protein
MRSVQVEDTSLRVTQSVPLATGVKLSLAHASNSPTKAKAAVEFFLIALASIADIKMLYVPKGFADGFQTWRTTQRSSIRFRKAMGLKPHAGHGGTIPPLP